MGRPVGQLERSITALAIAPQLAAAKRDRDLADTATGEYDQLVHVPLSGQAAPPWAPTTPDVPVQWEMPFLYAPLQHRVPFPTPHFHNPGIEMLSGTGELILFHAQVVGWTVTEERWYVGATLRFSVSAPNATANVPYSAIAHCVFTGWASMAEADEFTS
jgi:hypothetical protein